MKFKHKKFLSYYKPYLGLFVTVMLSALVVSSITLVLPWLMRYIAKNVLESGMANTLGQIYKIGALMLFLIAIQTVCSFYVDYRGHAMGAMMERDMRSELFTHIIKLPFRFFDDHKTGALMSRITNDLLLLSELYHHGPEDYLIYLVKFIGAIMILLSINAKLTFIIIAFLPVLGIFAYYFNKKMRIAMKLNYERIGDINAQLEDTLGGIRVVKSFTNEETEQRKFACESSRFLKSRKSIYRNEAYLYNGVNAIMECITVAVVVFGGAGIINASLDLADLLAFLLYTSSLTGPIQKLNHITMQLQQGVAGFERFMEIKEIEPDISDSKDAVELQNVQGNIIFKNVGFRYKDDHEYVLRNISLDIKAGEYIALVGISGVGKTTICSLIPRFYEVNEGEVLLDGKNIKKIRLESLRRNIGMVQQDIYLFGGTILENIRYGKPDATDAEIIEAAKRANAHDFIMVLPEGYHTDIGQRGIKLSGGQKQRLSIARAFLKNPPVLILDEATSSLDNDSEKVVQESLEELSKDRTTIVIAHRLSTIRNAKRIIVLTEEGIDEQGTHEELMKRNGVYYRLYNLQFEKQ